MIFVIIFWFILNDVTIESYGQWAFEISMISLLLIGIFILYMTSVLVFKKNEEKTECKISVNGKILEQVNEMIYLGTMFSRDGSYEMDVERRIAAGNSR